MKNSFSPDSCVVDSVRPAVNYGERRGSGIDILLYHYTGMKDADDADGALKWLCCKESGVSSHYFIYEDGRVIQLLPESVRAHHAGEGCWQGERDINSHSIGIEIDNVGYEADPLIPFPLVQMESVAKLSVDIIARHSITPQRVLGHSDIAPHRKSDPGELYDWAWLSGRGIGHYIEPEPITNSKGYKTGDSGDEVREYQRILNLYGYECEVDGNYTDDTATITRAFQRHFRPQRVDGIADVSTLLTLRNLCAALDLV